MTGWSGSTRRVTLPADWEARRLAVLERDRYQCQHERADTGEPCGLYATDCDHINDRNDHSLSNLRALCPWHHLRRSGQQGGRASQAARRARAAAEAPKHPGVLDTPIRPTRNDPPPF
ncbi:HNH endonuclease [Curtobacterium sp. Curtsp57]|uniref:HNH endonuclease n=1 Tax=Curtobacterium sp. Curtsp57 TaxID=3243047 RepID=UPI0039B4F22E